MASLTRAVAEDFEKNRSGSFYFDVFHRSEIGVESLRGSGSRSSVELGKLGRSCCLEGTLRWQRWAGKTWSCVHVFPSSSMHTQSLQLDVADSANVATMRQLFGHDGVSSAVRIKINLCAPHKQGPRETSLVAAEYPFRAARLACTTHVSTTESHRYLCSLVASYAGYATPHR